MNTPKYLLVIGMLVALLTRSYAQERSTRRFTPCSTLFLGAGSATYFGDLAGYNHPYRSLLTLPRWNIGAGYMRQFSPHLAVRGQFTWVRLVGDDYSYSESNPMQFATQFARNLHFRNDVKELSLSGQYNFIADGYKPNLRAVFTPYVFGGVALILHNPQAQTPTSTNNNNGTFEARRWVSLQPLHTEGQGQPGYAKPYSLLALAIPVGIGMRYQLSQNVNLSVDIGYRYTFTDYLDDVSGHYAQPEALQGLAKLMADRRFEADAARVNISRMATAEQLFQISPYVFTSAVRGSTSHLKDSYLLTNFSVHYVLSNAIKCPDIR